MTGFRIVSVVAGLAVFMTGCETVGKALGAGKNPPDEFAISTKAPLTVPPDFALRPPAVGETRPERLSTSERTRQLLLGDESTEPPSTGELALLQSIDAQNVDPNIRAILAAENGGWGSRDQSLTNQIVFWRINGNNVDDADAPLRVDDPEAWFQERRESIEAVTGEEEVTIGARERSILNLPGVR